MLSFGGPHQTHMKHPAVVVVVLLHHACSPEQEQQQSLVRAIVEEFNTNGTNFEYKLAGDNVEMAGWRDPGEFAPGSNEGEEGDDKQNIEFIKSKEGK